MQTNSQIFSQIFITQEGSFSHAIPAGIAGLALGTALLLFALSTFVSRRILKLEAALLVTMLGHLAILVHGHLWIKTVHHLLLLLLVPFNLFLLALTLLTIGAFRFCQWGKPFNRNFYFIWRAFKRSCGNLHAGSALFLLLCGYATQIYAIFGNASPPEALYIPSILLALLWTLRSVSTTLLVTKRSRNRQLELARRFEDLQRQITTIEHNCAKCRKAFAMRTEKYELESSCAKVGRVVAEVIHKVNTPIAVIAAKAGNLQFFATLSSASITDLQRHSCAFSEEIQLACQEVKEMMCAVRVLVDADEEKGRKTHDLKPIIQELLEENGLRFHRIGVLLDVNLCEGWTQCRDWEIKQILVTLLDNACDALERSSQKRCSISMKLVNRSIEIAIMDTGCGILPEHRRHIMEPLFTTKPDSNGHGLNLCIARRLAISHGGSLILDDEFPLTRFVLTLPLFLTQ